MEAILASAVVAAVISSIFGYIQYKKSENLKYITGERKRWREEIRTISEAISKCDNLSDLKPNLVKLKMRINPYGKFFPEAYYDDSHIWDIISIIESKGLNADINKEINILLEYLSLLLKRDWEISKQEVKGDLYKIIKWFACIVCIVVYTWTIYLYWNVEFSLKSLLPIFPVFLSFVSIPSLSIINFKSLKNSKIRNHAILCLINAILCCGLTITTMMIIGSSINIEKKIIGIIFVSIFEIVILITSYIIAHRDLNEKYNYLQNICLAKNDYKKEDK